MGGGAELRRLDDEVIKTVFLVAQSLCFFPGRQIIRQHEIPALDDIEHSFSSNPPAVRLGLFAKTIRRQREKTNIGPEMFTQEGRLVNSSIGKKPGVLGDTVLPLSTRLAQPSQ
jgi:hypothetical protein